MIQILSCLIWIYAVTKFHYFHFYGFNFINSKTCFCVEIQKAEFFPYNILTESVQTLSVQKLLWVLFLGPFRSLHYLCRPSVFFTKWSWYPIILRSHDQWRTDSSPKVNLFGRVRPIRNLTRQSQIVKSSHPGDFNFKVT